MNKQELIDKAVEHFKGVWPAKSADNVYMAYRPEAKNTTHYPFYVFNCEPIGFDFWHVNEFQQRARELGWINGYKYGVEYEINFKKPDLPEGTLLEVTYVCGTKTKEKLNKATFDFRPMYDPRPVSFRIVDEQFKPVESAASNEVEQVQDDWYDYDKQQAIALPPVGEWVEYDEYQNQKWLKVQIRGFWTENDKTSVWIQSVGKPNVTKDKFRPLDWNRKADEERQKFVELASRIMHQSQCGVINDISLGELYDAGCRFTEVKHD